jgi:hypothetical protein
MSFTSRGRRCAYDNIAAGSATGPERTIAGETVSPQEMFGGGYQTSTSTGDVWHTNIQTGASVTDGNGPENMGDGTATGTTDPTDERLG